jgi:hypothetical protein
MLKSNPPSNEEVLMGGFESFIVLIFLKYFQILKLAFLIMFE